MARHIRLTRSQLVLQLQRKLERDSFPRLQMSLLVAVSGCAGWLGSYMLLHIGVMTMALRYPLALAVAYLAFLGMLWLWLRTSAQDYMDVPDLSGQVNADPFASGDVNVPSITSGGGGDFAGGGASGSFDTGTPHTLDAVSSSSGGGGLDVDLDVGELAIPLLAIAMAVGLALASLYVVYLAPSLFAEVLFDGVLSYGLYRRLRQLESRHWLETAVRKTALPFVLTAVFLCIVGAALTAFAPGAHSLAEALQQASASP